GPTCLLKCLLEFSQCDNIIVAHLEIEVTWVHRRPASFRQARVHCCERAVAWVERQRNPGGGLLVSLDPWVSLPLDPSYALALDRRLLFSGLGALGRRFRRGLGGGLRWRGLFCDLGAGGGRRRLRLFGRSGGCRRRDVRHGSFTLGGLPL